jgi:hypothetical protein
MTRRLVTCPETANPELIDIVRSPLGTVVHRCTASRDERGACLRTCAALVDRRAPVGTVLCVRSCLRAVEPVRGEDDEASSPWGDGPQRSARP